MKSSIWSLIVPNSLPGGNNILAEGSALRIRFRKVLCYNKLHVLKLLFLFLKGYGWPSRANFWVFFHVKPSVAIVTTVSKKTFAKCRNKRDLFTTTYFRTKCELSKSIFPGKHPGSWNLIVYACPDFSCTWWSLLPVCI